MRKTLPVSNLLLPGLLVLLGASAGCGGGGGGTKNADAKLVLTAGSGYSGSSLRLAGDPTASVTNGTTVVAVSQGARTLLVVLPTTSPQNGTSYTFGQNGAGARYSEAVFGGSDNVWTGTGGTVAVKSFRNTLFLTLTNVTFAADSSNGSQAQGTFSLSGTITNVGF